MSEKTKIRLVVDEDAAIVARLDAMAEAEGIARSDILRRAIRLLVFSAPKVPTFGAIPEAEPADVTV
jgi:metal-responsive CopG/Arc/MetJ family transcriptional regulator